MFVGPWSMYIKCLLVLLTNVYWFRVTGGYICGCGRPSNLVYGQPIRNLHFMLKYWSRKLARTFHFSNFGENNSYFIYYPKLNRCCFRPPLCTLLRLNWTKQVQRIMRWIYFQKISCKVHTIFILLKLSCKIQNHFFSKFVSETSTAKLFIVCQWWEGVDLKGWVPSPHPGYHY